MPSSYWEERAKQEKAWQLKQLENDAEFGKLLETYYNQAIDDISDSIEKELNRVGKDQVTQMDVKAYETKAKSIVAEAEKMRANGQKVTYADFSDQVNQRLKVYNATMRINRLEHLKSEVGLDMLRAGVKVDSSLRDKLSGDYQKEVIRQAGIMMDSAQRSPWTGKDAAKILMAQTNGATFSQRLWADQDALKAKLDQVLSVGMIQGQNPRKMATRLREQVKTAVSNQRYVIERLARTESARIQNSVQLESIKKHGYNYVQWIAEPKACPACRAIASRDSGFGEGVYTVAKVPKIPDATHPNCRCSISETWVDGKDDNLVSGKRSKALEKAIGAKTAKKPKQLTDEELKETYLNNTIISKLGEKVSVELAKRLDKAPEPIKTVWAKYSDKMILDDYMPNNRAFYSPSRHYVKIGVESMNLGNSESYYQKQYDVFYHEFGHLIDGEALEGRVNVSDGMYRFIDQDYKTMLDERYNKLYGNGIKFADKVNGLGLLEGDSGRTIKLKKDGTPTVAGLRKLRGYVEDDMIKDIKRELRSNGYTDQDKGDISDMFGAIYKKDTFPFGVGHTKSYWSGPSDLRSTEFFAEATSATVNNPKSLELIKKYFPKTYAEYIKRLEKLKG